MSKSRRWDRKPETDQDKKFYDQRDLVDALPNDTDDDTLLAELAKLRDLVDEPR